MTNALVPREATQQMSRELAAGCDVPDVDLAWVVPVVARSSPNAGKVSREQMDLAAQKLREHKDDLYKIGLDKPWAALAERQRNFHRADVRVVLEALGLEIEESE